MSHGRESYSLSPVTAGPDRNSYKRIDTAHSSLPDSETQRASSEGGRDREPANRPRPGSSDKDVEKGLSKVSGVSLFNIWLLEAVACLVALIALVAIVVTTYSYHDQPLPDWPHEISINTLISIYVVVLRLAAGFILPAGLGQLRWKWFESTRSLDGLSKYDESTRGPWGSLQLLRFLSGRQIFACLGAFTTITMLLVDPFTQQMIKPYSCNRPDSNLVATLPRTSVYYGHGLHDSAGSESIDFSTQSAVNSAIFARNATQVDPNCPSGNCTFPALFNTIGFCHSCVDATSDLRVIQNRAPNGPITSLNITLLGDGYQVQSLNTSTLPHIDDAGRVMMVGVPTQPANRTAIVAAFIVAKQLCNSSKPQDFEIASIAAGANAFACTFSPCVRTINASVGFLNLHEEIVATYDNWGPEDPRRNYTRSMIDVTCLNTEQKTLLSRAGYRFGAHDTFIAYNVSVMSDGSQSTNPNALTAALPTECIYSVGSTTSRSLLKVTAELFHGGVSPQAGPYCYSPLGPAPLVHVYSEGISLQSINSSMSRVMDSLTSHVRQSEIMNHDLSKPASGIGDRTTTCLYIRWGWIAYAAFNVVALTAFFIAVVWQTGSGPDRCQHDFKSSALALVCTGLENNARNDVDMATRSGRHNELENVSRSICVKYLPSVGKFTKQA